MVLGFIGGLRVGQQGLGLGFQLGNLGLDAFLMGSSLASAPAATTSAPCLANRLAAAGRAGGSQVRCVGRVACPALEVTDVIEEFGAALGREVGRTRVVGAGAAQDAEGDLRQVAFVASRNPPRLIASRCGTAPLGRQAPTHLLSSQ